MGLLSLLLPLLAFAAPVPGRESKGSPDAMKVEKSSSETALFAGGRFWTLQRYFDGQRKQGVITTTTGYSGGDADRPTYDEVEKGGTGHREAVQVIFDPRRLSFEKLVEDFLRQTDPYDAGGQFCDSGEPFRSAIFYESNAQRRTAEAVIDKLERKLGKGRFATAVLPARIFHPAESLHQEFYNSNPVSYKLYVFGCDREERLAKIWNAK